MTPTTMLKAAAAGTLLALLAGCAGAPPPRLMLLANDGAQPAETAAVRPLLVVRRVALPEYLDRRAFVYRSSASEVTPFDDVVWAERLDVSVTRWIVEQLATDLPAYEVASTVAAERRPALTLNVELQSFEAVAPSSVHLRGSWHLSGDGAAGGPLAVEVPLPALQPEAAVQAMRAALAQATRAIVDGVRSVPVPGSAN